MTVSRKPEQTPLVSEHEDPLFWDCSEDEYHSDPESVSHSQIETFDFDPSLFLLRHVVRKFPAKRTAALDLGSLVHRCVLRPGYWANNVVMVDPTALSASGQRRGKAWQEFCDEHAGKEVVTEEEFEKLSCILDAIYAHDAARQLRERIDRFEVPLRWVEPEHGLRLRCKFDGLFAGVVVDLKTTRDARPRQFTNSILQYGYHRQAAWYIRGYEAAFNAKPAFVFLAVTTAPPFRVSCYDLDATFLELGEMQNNELLGRLAECYRTGQWHAKDHGQIITLTPPARAASEQWELQDVSSDE